LKRAESTVDKKPGDQIYELRLYVAGNEPNSALARQNLRRICDQYLGNRYHVEEIDVLKDFKLALNDRVFASPAVVMISPEPRALVIGNLSNEGTVISALRLGFEDGT
jgi:circadian clock protein KaiB